LLVEKNSAAQALPIINVKAPAIVGEGLLLSLLSDDLFFDLD
jgi:hypothetical protein